MPLNKILLKNIVQDKIDELKQSTVDSAARKRTAQLRDPKFKGEEVPIYKAGTKEEIGKRRKPGKGVIQLRLQGREESPGKPAKKPLYKKITPGATGRAARQDASHQPVYDRMAEMLIERSLFRDVYKGGKGLVGGLLGTKKDRRDNSKIYRSSRFIGSAVGTAPRAILKGGLNLVGSGLGKAGDLASGLKRKVKLNSILKQRELNKQQLIQQQKDKEKQATEKNKSDFDKLFKDKNQAYDATEKAKSDFDKLFKEGSTSYRDVMLQKIAEAMLIERGVPPERLHEWIGGVVRALPAIWNGARTLKTGKDLFNIVRTGYSAYKGGGGLGGAARAMGSRGLKTMARQFAGDLPFVGGALDSLENAGKKYVTSAMKRALGPAADKIKKGASIANKTSSAFKNKKEEKPEQDDTNLNYPYRGDEDDDQ